MERDFLKGYAASSDTSSASTNKTSGRLWGVAPDGKGTCCAQARNTPHRATINGAVRSNVIRTFNPLSMLKCVNLYTQRPISAALIPKYAIEEKSKQTYSG